MKNTIFIFALLIVFLMSCTTPVQVMKNYTVGVEMEARIGTAVAEWTIGSDWWQWMNNPPTQFPAGTEGYGRQLAMTKSLLFVGYDNDKQTIRVTYREFIDGLARAAFTQDLTFNSTDNAIVFENFEARIVSIDSKSLKYVVTQEHSDMKAKK